VLCRVEKRDVKKLQQNKPESRMRFHPQSVFGKAWYAHYAAAGLERLSDEEKRAEYNRFSAEWPDAHR